MRMLDRTVVGRVAGARRFAEKRSGPNLLVRSPFALLQTSVKGVDQETPSCDWAGRPLIKSRATETNIQGKVRISIRMQL
jgi:hypothetical protein